MLRILYWPLCVCTLSIIGTVLSFPIEIDVESKKEFPSEKLNVITRQDKLVYEIGKKNLERKDTLDDFLQAVRPRLFMLPAQDGNGVSSSKSQFLVIPVVVPYGGSASPGSKIPFAEGQLSIPEILKTNPFLAQMDSRHVAINILPQISPSTPPVTSEKVESTEGESESEESESTTFNTPVMQIQMSSTSTPSEITAVTKKAFVSDFKTTPEASTLKSVAVVTEKVTEKASSTSSTTVTENASSTSSTTVTTTTSTTTASSPVIPVTVTLTSSTAASAAASDYNYEYGDYSKASKIVETSTEKQLDEEDYNVDD